MNEYLEPSKDEIVMAFVASCIESVADTLAILQALKDFYRSTTCERFHDPATGLYLYSERYIAESYLMERNQS